jgi:hypothetical protein
MLHLGTLLASEFDRCPQVSRSSELRIASGSRTRRSSRRAMCGRVVTGREARRQDRPELSTIRPLPTSALGPAALVLPTSNPNRLLSGHRLLDPLALAPQVHVHQGRHVSRQQTELISVIVRRRKRAQSGCPAWFYKCVAVIGSLRRKIGGRPYRFRRSSRSIRPRVGPMLPTGMPVRCESSA